MPSRNSENGIALPLVLSVLLCLIAIAVPFALSMRHEHNSANGRIQKADALAEAQLLSRVVVGGPRATSFDVDPTPYWDSADEIDPDLEAIAEAYGFDDLGPRGRLWSAEIEDLSGRVDLNSAPLHVVGRLLGMSTQLVRSVDAESDEIRVADGDVFGESGYVWIQGEVTYFGARQGGTLYQLRRPTGVPGVWQPLDLGERGPRSFNIETEVFDFKAWMIAHQAFREGVDPEGCWDSVEHPRCIAGTPGVGGLNATQVERLRQWFRVHSADGGRGRWVNPQRVTNLLVSAESRRLNIGNGQFYGAGTTVKVTPRGGQPEYHVVLNTSRQNNGTWSLALEMPVSFESDSYETVVEARWRRPINVNTCKEELLSALLVDLPQPRADVKVTPDLATLVARRLVEARPLHGPETLDQVLDQMVEDDELDRRLRNLVYSNAYNASDAMLGYGTLPFCYEMEGTFAARSGASLNYELSGKEKARAFVREVFNFSGGGVSLRDYKTQRDFEEPWRLTRHARGWTTFPENLQLFHPSEAFLDPPGRTVGENFFNFNRFPSEKTLDVGVRLAPGRMLGYVSDFTNPQQGLPGLTDVTIHFDFERTASDDVDGWPLAEGAPPPFPVNGGTYGAGAVSTNARGEGRPEMVQITSNPTSQLFLRPFGVSMWWNPGESLGECTLFDAGVEAERNRVHLYFDGQQLIFDVYASELPAVTHGPQDSAGRITYAFDGNPPIEPDTWYHVTAFCRGNRAGQMSLWVDQRPRGERSFYTRLRSSAQEGEPTDPITSIADSSFQVEENETFPQKGVIKVGGEVAEYTSMGGGSFSFDPDPDDPLFGGRVKRGSVEVPSDLKTHDRTPTPVELYGYSALVAMETVPTGAVNLVGDLAAPYVAMVDPQSVQDMIEINGGAAGNVALGIGIEKDTVELTLTSLAEDETPPMGTFQDSGGYALLVSDRQAGKTIQIGMQPVVLDKTTQGSSLHGIEIISYTSYENGTLSGITRGHAVPARTPDVITNQGGGQGGGGNQNQQGEFIEPEAYLFTGPFMAQLGYPGDMPFLPLLVIPISVSVNDTANFPLPTDIQHPEMIQIDWDYQDDEEGSLEWIRYNSVDQVNHHFVRDDPNVLRGVANWLRSGTGDGSQLVNIGRGQGPTKGSQQAEDLFAAVNYEANLPEDVDRQTLDWTAGRMLAFRGVLGTYPCKHTGSAPIRPVWRVQRSGSSAHQPRPGRHDEVTLVDSGGRSSAAPYEITYSYPRDLQGWGGVTHLAFRDAVQQTWTSSMNTGGVTLTDNAGYVFSTETRLHTRMVKFPSGELPGVTPNLLMIGQEFSGSGGSSSAIIDEVRVFGVPNPDELTPSAMLVLEDDLEETDDEADVEEHAFWFPHGQRGSWTSRTNNLQPMQLVPEDAYVMQFGDEIVLGREVNRGDVDDNLIFIQEGRGAFGTEEAFHHRLSNFMLLPWFVVSRLTRGTGPADPELELADVTGFPPEGVVLVNEEAIGYSYNLSGGQTAPRAGILRVPTFFFSEEGGGGSGGQGLAAFRGRYGTQPQGHQTDDLVFWLPHRYPDLYAERADFPELGGYEIRLDARRAWFDSFSWNEHSTDGGSILKALVRVQGRGRFHGDPEEDPDLFLFDQPSDGDGAGHPIQRQGDQIVIRFYTEYRDGAMQPLEMTSNSWKTAPKMEGVVIEYVGDLVIEHHAEGR